VDLLVVISAQLLFLLWRPRAHWLGYISCGILGAHHEADLAGRIGWDGGVGILGHWEDFLAGFLEILDEIGVQPLVFGYIFHLLVIGQHKNRSNAIANI
jgi:hypothetical protein